MMKLLGPFRSRIGGKWADFKNNPDKRHAGRNVIALYVLYFANYLLGLLIMPVLAHRLGPASFGTLAVAQALALMIVSLAEFGFNFSANSAVRGIANDREALSRLYGAVTFVKLSIFILSVAGSLLIPMIHLIYTEQPSLFFATCAYALALALNPLWLFQGLGDLTRYSKIDLVARLGLALAIVAIVSRDTPLWAIQSMYAISATTSLFFSGILVFQRLDSRLPRWGDLRDCITDAAPLFLFRMTATVQPVINPLLLGPYVSTASLGNYVGAEKVSRFGSGLLLPLSEAIFPYMRQRTTASLNAHWWVLWMNVIIGSLLSAAIYTAAPWITVILLGPEFTETPRILRIFSLLPLLVGIINALGVQWMIPAGLTRQYNFITGSAFCLHVLFGILLSKSYGSLGMAAAVIISSIGAIAAMSFVIYRHYLHRPADPTSLASN